MTHLLQLAEQIEAAESGSRELSVRVGEVLGLTYSPSKARNENLKYVLKMPEFTKSVDAALGIVPEGWEFERLQKEEGLIGGIRKMGFGCTLRRQSDLQFVYGFSLLKQNAIIAASLRALAHNKGDL